MRHGLIDGDGLVYAGGFAADAQAKRDYIAERGSDEGFDIQLHHGPVEHALQATKQKLNAMLDRAECDTYTVYLSHPVNYREQMFPEYKANRNVLHKPFWYQEVIEYLLDRHAAVYSAMGDEADDALGIHQMQNLLAQDEWDEKYGKDL